MQDENGKSTGNIRFQPVWIAPGVNSYLKDSGKVTYDVVDDDEAMAAFDLMCNKEGIIPET